MNSIFVRLSRLTTATVLVAYGIVAGSIYGGIVRFLERGVDESLHTKASVLATLVRQDGERLEFDFDDALMPEFSRRDLPEYFELRRQNGRVFERSLSLGALDLVDPQHDPAVAHSSWDIRLPDGRHGRAVAIDVVPQEEEDDEQASPVQEERMRLVLAQGQEQLDSVRGALGTGLVIGGLALALIVTLGIRWALARGLAPLTELAREVDAVTPDALDVEFAARNEVRELAGIRSRLGELVARLGSALERERRFTSAAAHELRTPLAELKTLAQVCERWPEEQELRARMPKDVLQLSARMQATVDSLLAFARAHKASAAAPVSAVDATSMITRLLTAQEPRIQERKLSIHASIAENLAVAAEPTLLESVLRNLLDNAVSHAPAGTAIGLSASRVGPWVIVVTENDSGGVGNADLPHLFEPFWRRDSARHDGSHSGLGLALVDAWVRSWGGSLSAELVAGERLRFQLRLPAADPGGANSLRALELP